MFGLPAGGEWIIILLVVLLLFGGKKIPELMRGVGKGVGELQKGISEGKRQIESAYQDEVSKPDHVDTPAVSAPAPESKVETTS